DFAPDKRASGDTLFDDLPHPAVEPVAARDDELEVRRRQRFELKEERRSVQFVENRMHERDDQRPELLARRDIAVLNAIEKLQQSIERVLVTGEEDLLLVFEVVVEIAFLHVQRCGDLLDRSAVVAETPERF